MALISFSWQGFANATEAGPGKTPTSFEQLIPYIILGLVFYILLMRTQQRKYKQHGNFLSKIRRGDEVLTSSGIYGKIEGLTDSFVILEVAENVRIRIAKSQIASYAENNTDNQKTKPANKK